MSPGDMVMTAYDMTVFGSWTNNLEGDLKIGFIPVNSTVLIVEGPLDDGTGVLGGRVVAGGLVGWVYWTELEECRVAG